MISAWGIDHGVVSKSLKPQHAAAMARVKNPLASGDALSFKFRDYQKYQYAQDRLALHGHKDLNVKAGGAYKGPLDSVGGMRKKAMKKNTRTKRQLRDANRKPIFGESAKT